MIKKIRRRERWDLSSEEAVGALDLRGGGGAGEAEDGVVVELAGAAGSRCGGRPCGAVGGPPAADVGPGPPAE